jgi:hypothetical protein
LAQSKLLIQQRGVERYIVDKLPDGSTAIFDKATNTVHALDTCAAAAFEACREPVALAGLTARMSQQLAQDVTQEIALEAVAELERAGLVAVSEAGDVLRNPSRRNLLRAAGVAVPVVLSLTASDQKHFAALAASTTTTGGAPMIVSVTHFGSSSVNCDQTQTIQVVGQNTHFGPSTTVGNFSQALDPIETPTVMVTDPTHLSVSFFPSASDTNGAAFNFTITTGSEVLNVTNFLTVSCL